MAKIVAFLVSILTLSVALAYAPEPQNAPLVPPKVEKGYKVPKSEIQLLVSRYAFVYKVPEQTLLDVIACESTFNTNAVNITSREKSYGLVQINLLAHPYVTIEQATDPDFAIRFLAKNISEGRGYWWTCWVKQNPT